jgi:hypothetical protein
LSCFFIIVCNFRVSLLAAEGLFDFFLREDRFFFGFDSVDSDSGTESSVVDAGSVDGSTVGSADDSSVGSTVGSADDSSVGSTVCSADDSSTGGSGVFVSSFVFVSSIFIYFN